MLLLNAEGSHLSDIFSALEVTDVEFCESCGKAISEIHTGLSYAQPHRFLCCLNNIQVIPTGTSLFRGIDPIDLSRSPALVDRSTDSARLLTASQPLIRWFAVPRPLRTRRLSSVCVRTCLPSAPTNRRRASSTYRLMWVAECCCWPVATHYINTATAATSEAVPT